MNDVEREVLDLDVVFVGAGPASLAGAYHLGRLIEAHNAEVQTGNGKLEPAIAVLEKGKEIGSHAISGAVIDPRALRELMPKSWREAPFEGKVEEEELLWMTAERAFSMPIPPMLENDGKYVASLGRLLKWIAPQVEDLGVDIFCEFPAAKILRDGERVIGVRTGDRGIDHHGQLKANFEPGVDIHAAVTVLGEGPRGTLAKQLEGELGIADDSNPQSYALGIKEVWELPAGSVTPGSVIHTMGWPLDSSTFGGGFIYGMADDLLIVGLVIGLDYKNPLLDPHQEFQRFKTNPRIAKMLAGGKMAYYGAKAIPEGGWWSMPKLHGDGFLITGDSGGFLNSQRLKGVHLAMKSGMLAAETIFDGLTAGDLGAERLASYRERVETSWIHEEMWPVRNFHQAFDFGIVGGMLQAGLGMLTNGRGWGLLNRLRTRPGHEHMARLDTTQHQVPEAVAFDGELTFDKLADVYNSGAAHDEDQPAHLVVHDTDICIHQCAEQYGNPCQRFCPANVYEMVEDSESTTGQRLQINFSNCVHCKTCDIMDPYQIISWVTPEGGGGPNYSKM